LGIGGLRKTQKLYSLYLRFSAKDPRGEKGGKEGERDLFRRGEEDGRARQRKEKSTKVVASSCVARARGHERHEEGVLKKKDLRRTLLTRGRKD